MQFLKLQIYILELSLEEMYFNMKIGLKLPQNKRKSLNKGFNTCLKIFFYSEANMKVI